MSLIVGTPTKNSNAFIPPTVGWRATAAGIG
jgi:hypothetical protein